MKKWDDLKRIYFQQNNQMSLTTKENTDKFTHYFGLHISVFLKGSVQFECLETDFNP